MDLVTTWVGAPDRRAADGWTSRQVMALGVLGMSLALIALPAVVATLVLLGLVS